MTDSVNEVNEPLNDLLPQVQRVVFDALNDSPLDHIATQHATAKMARHIASYPGLVTLLVDLMARPAPESPTVPERSEHDIRSEALHEAIRYGTAIAVGSSASVVAIAEEFTTFLRGEAAS